MESLVIDSSVAIKWFVDEVYSQEAGQILAAYESGRVSLLAPDLINAEFGNIVWKKHAFQGLIDSDAREILTGFQQLRFDFTPTYALLSDAYTVAASYGCTVYDSLYVSLAIAGMMSDK